ncbi:MAG: transporter substrate-binding domain-containing protein, partial [Emcibacteraceae bacterium]|nr:transporter substrate-binding domain-containing protein [Emcibacteraceae bacterium]
DIELAKGLALSLNVEIEFVKTTWPTSMDDLMADKFDIGMSGITITPERQSIAMFSLPMHKGGKAAISRDNETEKFDTIAEINQPHVRVIFNPGGTNELYARENFPNSTLIENEDNITIFSKIVSGEVDVMVTDAIETLVQERIHPDLEAVNARAPFSSSQKAYLIQKDEKFKTYLDQWIGKLKSTEELSNIINSQLEKSAQQASELGSEQ